MDNKRRWGFVLLFWNLRQAHKPIDPIITVGFKPTLPYFGKFSLLTITKMIPNKNEKGSRLFKSWNIFVNYWSPMKNKYVIRSRIPEVNSEKF